MANPKPIIDEEFPYLFPVKPGLETEIFHISNAGGDFMGSRVNGKWYSLGFTIPDSETVVASRKGLVVKVIESNEDTPKENESYQFVTNSVRLLHDDGTIAEYTNFATNGVFCEPGETVFPGQPLGKAGRNNYIGLTVFYSDLRSKNYKVLIPKFFVKEEGTQKILAPGTYISDYTVEILGLEMTRKERKRILGSKK